MSKKRLSRIKTYWKPDQIVQAKRMLRHGFNRFHLSGDGKEVVAVAVDLRIFRTNLHGNHDGFLVDVSWLTDSDHVAIYVGDNTIFCDTVDSFLFMINNYGLVSVVENLLGNTLIFNASMIVKSLEN